MSDWTIELHNTTTEDYWRDHERRMEQGQETVSYQAWLEVQLNEARTQLRSQRTLVQALQPFSDAYGDLGFGEQDTDTLTLKTERSTIQLSVADLHRAAQALRPLWYTMSVERKQESAS